MLPKRNTNTTQELCSFLSLYLPSVLVYTACRQSYRKICSHPAQYPPLKGKSAHFSAHNFHLKYEFKVFLSLASPHKNNSAAICIFDVLEMNTKMTHVLFIRCLYLLVNTLLQTSYNLSIQKSCFCIKLLVSVILETMTRASISGLQSSSYTMILKSTSGFSSLITAIIVSL